MSDSAHTPHSTPKYEGSTLNEILRLAREDVANGEQGTRGMYARALRDLVEQLEAVQDAERRSYDALRSIALVAGAAGSGEIPAMPIAAKAREVLYPASEPHDA